MITVFKQPGRKPIVLDIDNDLKTLQRMVEGFVEHISMYHYGEPAGFGVLVNEEGKLRGMRPNFRLYDDMIVGPALFVGDAGEDFTDLTEAQINEIMGHFTGFELMA